MYMVVILSYHSLARSCQPIVLQDHASLARTPTRILFEIHVGVLLGSEGEAELINKKSASFLSLLGGVWENNPF